MTTVFIVSGATWTVPGDCIAVDQVDCIAAGGSGGVAINQDACNGGTGGAFSRNTTKISVTPGGSINIGVGAGGTQASRTTAGITSGNNGGDTWWNATSLANAVTNGTTLSCAAEHGKGGTASASSTGSQTGGQAANGVGTLKTDGGGSGSSGAGVVWSASGGGGAGGPTAAGAASAAASSNATAGGNADVGGTGAGAGSGSSIGTTTSAGGNGTEYDASHGCGGGSGAVASTTTVATIQSGAGGNYGGGSGGVVDKNSASVTVRSGTGGPGLIVVTYTPSVLVGLRRRQYLRR